MRELRELDKLECWLDKNGRKYGYTHERFDEENVYDDLHLVIDRHQIVVNREICGKVFYQWDVICHYGSYGADDGLLEVMGKIVADDVGDDVLGYLTANDVVELIRRCNDETVA